MVPIKSKNIIHLAALIQGDSDKKINVLINFKINKPFIYH